MEEPSAGLVFWELLGDFPSNKMSSIKDTTVIQAIYTTGKAIVLRLLPWVMVSMELLLPATWRKSSQVMG